MRACVRGLPHLAHDPSHPTTRPPTHPPPSQELKCESEEEKTAYDELQAQLLAAHPSHLPLLLERLQRAQKTAAGAAGEEAPALQVLGWRGEGCCGSKRLPASLAACIASCMFRAAACCTAIPCTTYCQLPTVT